MKPNLTSPWAGGFCAPLWLVAVLSAVVVTAQPASGATRVWTGDGANANWSTPANWFGNAAPQNGDDVVFPGAASRLANIANLPGLALNSIRFTGAGYSITGNSLVLSNGIVFDPPFAADTATLGVALSFIRSQTIQATRGVFTLGGALDLQSPAAINQTRFSASPGARIVATGVVNGTNNVLVSGGGEVQFDAFGGTGFRGKLRAENGTAIVEGLAAINNTVDLEAGTGGIVEFKRSQAVSVFRFLRVKLEENSQLLMNRVQLITGQVTLFGNSLIDGNEQHFSTPGFNQIDFTVLQPVISPNGFIVRATNGPAVIRDTEVGFGHNLAYFDVAGSATPALAFDATIEGGFGFEKLGNGYLRFSNSNSFGGLAVQIQDGTVEVRHPLGLGEVTEPFLRRDVELTGSGALVLRNVTLPGGFLLRAQGNAPLPGGGVGSSLFAFGNCGWPGSVQLDSSLFVFANDFTLSGPVAGAGGMECSFGIVRLNGTAANTFTGPLTADCELVELAKPSGVRAYAGPLVVGRPNAPVTSEVRWLNAYQNVGATLTLYSNAIVNLNGFNEDFGAVTFNGGRVNTGAGQFAIYQPLTVNPSSAGAVINGFLGLPPGNAVFVVHGGGAICDLQINAVVFGSASLVVKRGEGAMCLTAANTYTGLTIVEDGLLVARLSGGLGATDAGTTVHDGATLSLGSASGTLNESLSLRGAGVGGQGALQVGGNVEIRNQFPSIFPAMEIGSNTIVHVESGQLTITGEIRGNGSFTKTGPGALSFAGSQANTYTGETRINEGMFLLNKPTGVTTVPSHLSIGGGAGIIGPSATARHFGGFAIIGSVTVNRGGLWDLNGFSEGFTVSALEGRPPLTLNGGGDVQTGAGSLFLPTGGDVVVNPGSGFGGASFIAGNLGLDPGPHRFIVADGLSGIGIDTLELDLSAAITQTSTAADLVKEGFGEMRLGASNSFSGPVTVNGGRITAAHSSALGTTTAGTFVNNNASLALDGGITVSDESLTLDSTNAFTLVSLGSVTNAWGGQLSLQRTAGIFVADPSGVLSHFGVPGFGTGAPNINGPGGFTKFGPGALLIAGLNGVNTYTGPTTVSEGLLEAVRGGRSLSSNIVVTGPNATLRTGRATGNIFTSVPTVLPRGANVAIENGALWTMTGTNSETLGRLTGDGRLTISTGGALTITNDVSCAFSGQVSGSGALNKRGPATLHFTGNSPGFTGLATVFDGTYKVDAQFLNSPVTVKTGSQLRGNGVVGDVLVESGGVVRVDPDGRGRLGGEFVMNSANFQSGSVLGLAFYGAHPTGGNDYLFVNNAVTLGSPTLSSGFNYPAREGDVITLINKNAAGAVSGAMSSFPEGAVRMIGDIPVVAGYAGGDGNDVTLTVTNLPLRGGGTQVVSGNGGGELVPNDCSQLWLVVTNRGAVALAGLHGKLRSLTEGVVVTKAESAFPNLAPNARGSNATPFQIRIEPSFLCGGGAQFELVLTASNAPSIAILYTLPGSSGSALQLDGRGDQAEVPRNTFASVVNNFTIELWANPTGNRTETAETNAGASGISVPLRQLQRFAVFPDRGNLAYGLTHVSAGLSIGRNGISTYEHGTNPALAAIHLPSRLVYSNTVSGWTHVALVYANRRPQLYVNGALVRSSSTASLFTSVHPSGSLGGSSQADFGNFQGQLDEVRIWNVALSASQIQSNMTRRLTGTEPNLVTYFRCDENGGGTLTDSAPASPNPTGTLMDDAAFVFPGVSLPGDLDCNSGRGACESCLVVSGRFTTNAVETVRRLTATALPSVCDPIKPCPGFDEFPTEPVSHVLHHFTNSTTTELCVTAQLRPDCPNPIAGAYGVAAYAGEFLTDQPCSFYLGDDGAAEALPPPFSFRVPPQTNFVLVVTARISITNLACDTYTLELFGVPCPPPRLDIARDTTPDKVLLQWSSAYPDFHLQSVNSLESNVPFGFNNVIVPPVLINGKFTHSNIVVEPRQFFRLAK